MDDLIRYIIITVCVIVVLISIICIITSITKKRIIKRKKMDIAEVLNDICKNIEGSQYSIIENECYNYELKTPKAIYYIKIIDNSTNEEICINNSTKWQLRRSFNDSSLRFVPNVDAFMRKELKGKKIFIIYPNARSLLKYINECEMIIVRSDTDVYGTNVITYAELKEENTIIV